MIRFIAAIVWVLVAPVLARSQTAQPNMIFVLVDDQGYYDLGCYGATEFRTPRIDAMAQAGIRFSDYYAAAPICSPSRAGLLTGCYPRRVGNHIWVHRADSPGGLHPDELTLAELLQQHGYATACIGKWHLGFREPFQPHNQGFDHYFGLFHNLDPVETVYFEAEQGVPLLRNGEVVKRPVNPAELTRLYTDEALRFIEQQRAGPFFLYLPHTMLHNPLGVSEEFRGSSQFGDYGDATQELDHHIGRILDKLQELSIDQQTIVVYASDNGREPGRTKAQPLRGHKLSTYEGGLRVPAIVWGPGVGLQAGQVSSALVHAMDWYPTLASLAHIPIPSERVIDGRDLSPLLLGQTDTVSAAATDAALNAAVPLRRRWEPRREWASLIQRHEYHDAFFYHSSEGALAAVRWQQWKLMLHPSPQLFHLTTDPGETQPVRNAEITRKLRGMAILFEEEMNLTARPVGHVNPTEQSANGLAATDRSATTRTTIPPAIVDSLHAQLDVTYARYGEQTLQMDIYRPRHAWGQLPAVVCIHGGGWANGNRASHRPLAQALAARGYVTANISYRLSGQAPFPAAIHDCKAAVRYLRAHASELGINPECIGAMGLSAGGHLAALLATSAGASELEGEGGQPEVSSAIQAAVPMGAQTDLLSERTGIVSATAERGKFWRQFLGGSQAEKPDSYRLASPLHHLDSSDPPCLFITGGLDDPSTHATEHRARMKQLGITSDLIVIADAPHAFLNQPAWFDPMLTAADQFFKQTLAP